MSINKKIIACWALILFAGFFAAGPQTARAQSAATAASRLDHIEQIIINIQKQIAKIIQQLQSITDNRVSPAANSTLPWKTYKNAQYGFEFDYPPNYIISTGLDCDGLTDDQSNCLLSLAIHTAGTDSDYVPDAGFRLLKGMSSVHLFGQASDIRFDSQKGAWVFNDNESSAAVLPIWDHTKSNKEIIRSSLGGSGSSSYYYLISNYKNDEVVIFEKPLSIRMRCYLLDDESKAADCNNFYKSVIDKYNGGKLTVDTWLPENYLDSIYSNAEGMVKSFKNTAE